MSSKPFFVSPQSLLGRKIYGHLQKFHCDNSRGGVDGVVSRRNFLTNAAGAAGFVSGSRGLLKARKAQVRARSQNRYRGELHHSASSSTTSRFWRLQRLSPQWV